MPHRDSRARAEAALQLRAKRLTWQEIADELGFRSRHGARSSVERLLGRRSANPLTRVVDREASAESLRMQEQALQPLLDSAVSRHDAEVAVSLSRELRALVSDRAKLTGISAPQQVDVNVAVSSSAILADAKRRLLAIDNVIEAEVIEA